MKRLWRRAEPAPGRRTAGRDRAPVTGILGAAVLAGYAAALGIAVPPILRRAGWVLCAPGVAIGVWLALSVSWLTAVVLAGLVLARPLLARLEPAWLAHGAGMTSAGRGASAVLAATA